MTIVINELKPYVCPKCNSNLSYNKKNYSCDKCQKDYSNNQGIPDFFIESDYNQDIPTIKSVQFIDSLAKVYESPLWYPIVYHLYGGIKIPKIKETVRRITEMIDPKGCIVLDVACGTGIYTRSIAKQARLVHGIDISQGMLEKARYYAFKEKLNNIELCIANVEKLPFSNQFFEAASCSGALHLFPDTLKALKEISRVLKPNSPLAVMTFTRRRFLKYKFVYNHIKEDHGANIFDLRELSVLLKEGGFKSFKPIIYGSMLLFSARKA
jgi:SAM-dependent methyltransferase